jgi:hypothetical protein
MTTGCARCMSPAGWADGSLEQLAVHPDGPTFLRRCVHCGTLWDETLRAMTPISAEAALVHYPSAAGCLQSV